MTTDAKRLIRVFLSLSEADKKEVAEFIKSYDSASYFEKGQRSESFLSESKVLGPISSDICRYCGK
jgi:hypothetical protein